MKIPRLYYIVSVAEVVPSGYGIAYRKWNQDIIVVLPIPINLIVRWSITIYYGLVKAWYPTRWDKKLDSIWRYGYEAGRVSRQHEITMLNMRNQITEDILIKTKKYIGG